MQDQQEMVTWGMPPLPARQGSPGGIAPFFLTMAKITQHEAKEGGREWAR